MLNKSEHQGIAQIAVASGLTLEMRTEEYTVGAFIMAFSPGGEAVPARRGWF